MVITDWRHHFIEWVEDLHRTAKSRNSRLRHTYARAITSLKKCNEPLLTAFQATKLPYIGEGTAKLLHARMLQFCKDNHLPEPRLAQEYNQEGLSYQFQQSTQQISYQDGTQQSSRPCSLNICNKKDIGNSDNADFIPEFPAYHSLKDCSDREEVSSQIRESRKKAIDFDSGTCTADEHLSQVDSLQMFRINTNSQNSATVSKSKKQYVPRQGSGAFAILIGMHRAACSEEYIGYMTKREIIAQAQPFCMTSFSVHDAGTLCTAWSGMSILIKRNLVHKSCNPTKYSLTKAGGELAQRLYKLQESMKPEQLMKANDDLSAKRGKFCANHSSIVADSLDLHKNAFSWAGRCSTPASCPTSEEFAQNSSQMENREHDFSSDLNTVSTSEVKINSPTVKLEVTSITRCDNCDVCPAVYQCQDCLEVFCATCDTFIHQGTKRSQHIRVSINETNINSTAVLATPKRKQSSKHYGIFSPLSPIMKDNLDEFRKDASKESSIQRYEKLSLSERLQRREIENLSPYSSQACSESLTPDAISAKSTETALLATGTDHPVYGSQDRAFASRATPSNDTQQPQPKKLSRGQRRRKQEENRIQLIQDQKILQHQHKAKIQISRQKLRDPYLSPTGTGRTTANAFVLEPGTYEIVLVVDVMEHTGSRRDKGVIQKKLVEMGVSCEIRKLSIGDFLWIARERTSPVLGQLLPPRRREIVLDYIIERKRIDDLATSIMDGRFKEQAHRLEHCSSRNPIYLIEHYGKKSRCSLSQEALRQSINNTYCRGFFVKETASLNSTVAYLTLMTRFLEQFLQNRPIIARGRGARALLASRKGAQVGDEFGEFNDANIKSPDLTVSQMLITHLMHISRLTIEKAAAIVHRFPTPAALSAAAKKDVLRLKEILAEIRYKTKEGPRKTIGPTLAGIIAQMYS